MRKTQLPLQELRQTDFEQQPTGRRPPLLSSYSKNNNTLPNPFQNALYPRSVPVEPEMTNTKNDGVRLYVRKRAMFKRDIELSKTQKVNKWFFDNYSFKEEDIKLIQQLRCQNLCLFRPQYSGRYLRTEKRDHVVLAFLNLRDINYLLFDNLLRKSLLNPSDLHRFVYRYPISQTLRSIYFVLPRVINHSLAKGLEYAEGIKEVQISFDGSEPIDYVFRYYTSPNSESITLRNAPAKDCVALMKHLKHTQLQRLRMFDYSVKSSEVISKYVSGILLKQPTINHTYGIGFRDDSSPLKIFQNQVFEHLGLRM